MISFNGVSLDTYNANIFRIDTDTAPVNSYNVQQIPGRNGDLILSNNRFQNVLMKYWAVFEGENAETNFSDMKNYLLSLNGYQRLEDTEHPDEFYLAYVSQDISPVQTPEKNMIKAEIVFTRKPQRYLISGETTYYWAGGSTNLKGQDLEVFALYLNRNKLDYATSVQGYPVVENPPLPSSQTGTGRHLHSVKVYIDDVGVYTISAVRINDEAVSLRDIGIYNCSANLLTKALSVTEVIKRLRGMDGNTYLWSQQSQYTYRYIGTDLTDLDELLGCDLYPVASMHGDPDVSSQYYIVKNGSYIEIHDERYSSLQNFCGYLEGSLGLCQIVFSITSPRTYTINDTRTINIPTEGIFNIRVETTFANGKNVQTRDDAKGALEMQYTTMGENMINPTVHTSQPLIRVYGNGKVVLNDITMTIATQGEYVDIDCEMMDCYEGGTNRNNDVTFSTYDFPELKPGTNKVKARTGIIEVDITPRWWRL